MRRLSLQLAGNLFPCVVSMQNPSTLTAFPLLYAIQHPQHPQCTYSLLITHDLTYKKNCIMHTEKKLYADYACVQYGKKYINTQ